MVAWCHKAKVSGCISYSVIALLQYEKILLHPDSTVLKNAKPNSTWYDMAKSSKLDLIKTINILVLSGIWASMSMNRP